MATESIRVSSVVTATPEQVWDSWMDGREHSAMTGGKATIDPRIGGSFSAWDGYIWGRTLELEPGRRIVQTWRTTEFPFDAPDSRLEVELELVRGGTRITLVHSEIPEGQSNQYRDGWRSFYFEPMTRYFEAVGRPTQIMEPPGLAKVEPSDDAPTGEVTAPARRLPRRRKKTGKAAAKSKAAKPKAAKKAPPSKKSKAKKAKRRK